MTGADSGASCADMPTEHDIKNANNSNLILLITILILLITISDITHNNNDPFIIIPFTFRYP